MKRIKQMLDMLKEAGSIVLAVLALMVLVAGAAAVYFRRGRKVAEISSKATADLIKIKEAEKRGDGATIKKEILERVKKARGRG